MAMTKFPFFLIIEEGQRPIVYRVNRGDTDFYRHDKVRWDIARDYVREGYLAQLEDPRSTLDPVLYATWRQDTMRFIPVQEADSLKDIRNPEIPVVRLVLFDPTDLIHVIRASEDGSPHRETFTRIFEESRSGSPKPFVHRGCPVNLPEVTIITENGARPRIVAPLGSIGDVAFHDKWVAIDDYASRGYLVEVWFDEVKDNVTWWRYGIKQGSDERGLLIVPSTAAVAMSRGGPVDRNALNPVSLLLLHDWFENPAQSMPVVSFHRYDPHDLVHAVILHDAQGGQVTHAV